jgi:hypothetical protein
VLERRPAIEAEAGHSKYRELDREHLSLFAVRVVPRGVVNFADQNQMINFLKNMMMAGGLLQIVAFGAGALSIDNRSAKGGAQEKS